MIKCMDMERQIRQSTEKPGSRMRIDSRRWKIDPWRSKIDPNTISRKDRGSRIDPRRSRINPRRSRIDPKRSRTDPNTARIHYVLSVFMHMHMYCVSARYIYICSARCWVSSKVHGSKVFLLLYIVSPSCSHY